MSYLLLLLLALAAAQQDPLSNCLSGCIACKPLSPAACLPLLNATSGTESACLPFYEGPNCTHTTFAYYNLYNETGPFFNWSLPAPPPPVRCELLETVNGSAVKTGKYVESIGPFSSKMAATKSLQFSSVQGVGRLLVKIGVAVADARLYNSSQESNSVSTETVDAEGNTVIETVTVTNSTATVATPIPFFTLTLTDQLSSQVVANRTTLYKLRSHSETSCGFLYQYQFDFDAPADKPFQQLLLALTLSNGSSVQWNLVGFSVEAGCSGFAVTSGSGKCNTCLSGFYGVSGTSGLEACKVCDFRCSTCSSATRCLLCEAYTTFNSKTGMCEYPDSYKIYRNFTVKTGKAINGSTGQFSTIIGSQAQILTLATNLSNTQSYLIKFYLLFSKAYADKLTSIIVNVNGSPYTTLTTLDLLSSTLSPANSASSQLFIKMLKIDLMGKTVPANFSLTIVGSSTSGEQFWVGDLVLVQYQCGLNCQACTFNPQQVTSCTACSPFFSLALNCRTCANGFYLRNESICVKCYSNCKQCSGANSYACTQCFDKFQLSDYSFNQTCISCLFDFVGNSSITCDPKCPTNYTKNNLLSNINCNRCLLGDKQNLVESEDCKICWVAVGLASGRCVATVQSGFTFYASDLTIGQNSSELWKGSEPLSTISCGVDYNGLLGVSNHANSTSSANITNSSNLTNAKATPTTLTYNLGGLPSHSGLIVVLNIFKIDGWIGNGTFALTISVGSTASASSNSFNISLTNSYGGQICGDSANEMIWALQTLVGDHTGDQVYVTVSSPDRGIFVRQLEIYLGNCFDCDKVGLSFTLTPLPMYSKNSTQTGLDVWITFNHQVSLSPAPGVSIPQTSKDFANSFNFKIGNKQILNKILLENKLVDQGYIKYFLPVEESLINATLRADTEAGDLVETIDGSIRRQLSSSGEVVAIDRYENVSLDTRKSVNQLTEFFSFFAWFCLIVMIICVLLGVGVVFEEFLLTVQLAYLHIYITSALLPSSVKLPLAAASRMEHLNFFSDIRGIEDALFGNLFLPCNFIFQQYNIDVYFLRSVYPLLFITALYLVWLLIFKLVNRFLPPFRQSTNRVIRFLRSIPQRPLAYLDQISRYQFLALMWAVMIQFTSFKRSSDGQSLNLASCVLALIFGIVWPLAVTIYTYKQHKIMNVSTFRYLYHDMYYLKISSVADEPKSYIYVAIRYTRLLAYAIFIGLFVNQSIIGPIILIFVNFTEGLIAYFLSIYRETLYMLTRVIENLLFIVAAILFLVVFGFSNRQNFDHDSYQNIGFGISTVFVLLVINAIIRFFYLTYKKVTEWSRGTYDIGEQGEKELYEQGRPIKLAQSERL